MDYTVTTIDCNDMFTGCNFTNTQCSQACVRSSEYSMNIGPPQLKLTEADLNYTNSD